MLEKVYPYKVNAKLELDQLSPSRSNVQEHPGSVRLGLVRIRFNWA